MTFFLNRDTVCNLCQFTGMHLYFNKINVRRFQSEMVKEHEQLRSMSNLSLDCENQLSLDSQCAIWVELFKKCRKAMC